MSDPKIEAVRRMYEAFGRGDLDAILAELADDVDWVTGSEAPDQAIPWFGSYRSKGDVPRFFKEIASAIDVTEFEPLSFTSNDTDVMVAVRWTYTVKATGKRASVQMLHWWRFEEGKVVLVRTLEDVGASTPAFA